jgi:type III pantothenate kinase
MTLLVDVGNTRVKWARCDEHGRPGPLHAAGHADWGADEWQRALFADAPRHERVYAACVAGGERRRLLEQAAHSSGARAPVFVASTASAAGVRNAYSKPELLGVDRWMGLLGAWHLRHAPCCVVDVGTAATVDALDADGTHLGGFIVPGPQLMVRSLHAGTSDLAAFSVASEAGAAGPFADNTRDAIERGCCLALAALIDRSLAELRTRVGRPAALVVTGGAIGLVQPYVVSEVRQVPDLVLHGLARLAVSDA